MLLLVAGGFHYLDNAESSEDGIVVAGQLGGEAGDVDSRLGEGAERL